MGQLGQGEGRRLRMWRILLTWQKLLDLSLGVQLKDGLIRGDQSCMEMRDKG